MIMPYFIIGCEQKLNSTGKKYKKQFES